MILFVISFLSMGAIFSVFAAYYYWSPKIFGFTYSEFLAKIHFWLFLIGVNLTFLPMHFLGLNGQPRRISDYPDCFSHWNYICSLGSMISLISAFLFIYIVYRQFTDKSYFYTWVSPEYFNYRNLISKVRAEAFEFNLPNPPKYHHFSDLPVM